MFTIIRLILIIQINFYFSTSLKIKEVQLTEKQQEALYEYRRIMNEEAKQKMKKVKKLDQFIDNKENQEVKNQTGEPIVLFPKVNSISDDLDENDIKNIRFYVGL